MTRPARPLDVAADTLARAFLDGEWAPPAMAARGTHDLGDDQADWVHELAEVAVRAFPERPADARRELTALLRATDQLHVHVWRDRHEGRWRPRPVLVAPAMGRRRWPVPVLDDPAALGEWLGLAPTHLDWFADVRSLERGTDIEPLRHYRYRWLAKRTGGARPLEAPKPMLRHHQRRILHEVLDAIPVHDAAHGFRTGRSVRSFAAPHVGRAVVVRLDLAHFFASVTAGRAFGIFRGAGYPEPVAHRLTGLVTNTVPVSVRRAAPRPPDRLLDEHRRLLRVLAAPHLPAGAPTSPALANLAAFRLDRRLAALAASMGATYTRYADDLALSGDASLRRQVSRLVDLVTSIAADEGFRVHPAKTLVATASQRQVLTGLVVNHRVAVDRRAYDRLRAVLHDAVTQGPDAANRQGHPDFRAHLAGRIEWVGAGHPTRAAKLQRLFTAIEW